jgi:hypothetical protein
MIRPKKSPVVSGSGLGSDVARDFCDAGPVDRSFSPVPRVIDDKGRQVSQGTRQGPSASLVVPMNDEMPIRVLRLSEPLQEAIVCPTINGLLQKGPREPLMGRIIRPRHTAKYFNGILGTGWTSHSSIT